MKWNFCATICRCKYLSILQLVSWLISGHYKAWRYVWDGLISLSSCCQTIGNCRCSLWYVWRLARSRFQQVPFDHDTVFSSFYLLFFISAVRCLRKLPYLIHFLILNMDSKFIFLNSKHKSSNVFWLHGATYHVTTTMLFYMFHMLPLTLYIANVIHKNEK